LEAVLALFRGAVAEARELSSVATVTAGQSPPGSTYNEAENGLPFFQGSAQFGDLVPSVLKWCSEPSRVAEAGDILFSVRAPVGDINIAHIRCCIGRGLAGIRSEFPAVLYAALKSASDEWSIHDASGTVFGSISGRDLRATKVPWPVDVEAVSYQLEPLMAAALAAEEEAQIVRKIRDSLLPRLVSGILRIPDPQALLEPVG
jgi:type I restriction enzyme S subunit